MVVLFISSCFTCSSFPEVTHPIRPLHQAYTSTTDQVSQTIETLCLPFQTLQVQDEGVSRVVPFEGCEGESVPFFL